MTMEGCQGTTDDTPTVLVVEDERALADTYAAWLADEYDVLTAYRGEEALELFDGADVDVALLDRRLPGLSGDEVLDRLRARAGRCRVGMVTAVEPDVDVLELGFDDYVVKPVLREELHELVERLVRRAEYDDRVQEHFALASKLAALETHRTDEELAASEEYARLRERLRTVEEQLDADRSALTDEDFAALLRQQWATASE